MKTGKLEVKDFHDYETREMLRVIVSECVRLAGEDYGDFGRSVTKMLKQYNLVDYGQ